MNLSHNESAESNKKRPHQSGDQPIPSSENMGGEVGYTPGVGTGTQRASWTRPESPLGNHSQDRSLVVSSGDGVPVVDSRVIAEKCGVQHESIQRAISEYQTTIEEAFGILRFEIGVLSGAGQPPRFALLTEDQATFLITLTRNTPQVVAFKAALVKAFAEAKRQLSIPAFRLPTTFAESLRMLADSEEAKERLTLQVVAQTEDIERMTPKEEFFDCAMTSKGAMLIREAAKLLNPDIAGGIGEHRLFRWMRKNSWLFGENCPYQTKVDAGYLVSTERPVPTNHGTIIKHTTRVTQRGIVALRKALLASVKQLVITPKPDTITGKRLNPK